MNKLVIAAAVLTATAGAYAVDWQKDFVKTYAEAQKQAQKADKPMYLHFTTTWCGWCRKLENEVYSSEQGHAALNSFVCATLDCTTKSGPGGNQDLMKRFGLSGYPSLAIVTADGAVMDAWAGYMALEFFVKRIEKANKSFEEYKDFLKETQTADKKSYEFNLKAMNTYDKYQKWDSAAAAARQVRKLDPNDEKGDGANAACVAFEAAMHTGTADKAKTALDDVKKADPKNEKGIMEKAMCDYAQGSFDGARYREGIVAMNDLIAKASKLTGEQKVYALLGDCQYQLKDYKAAKVSYEKAVAADPNSRMAAGINKRLDELKNK